MALPVRWLGRPLQWIDERRDGLPITDPFGLGHILNPYIFTDDGAECLCRLCEPLLWQYEPLPLTFDSWLPVAPPSARNGMPWCDLDSELFARLTEFTPL
jgi:hypothetical protein